MMLWQIEEYGKYVEITAFKGISFDQADAFLKATRKQKDQKMELQFFEADLVATQEHLYFAVLNALQAFRNKTNISKSIAMETMLYASACRQIKKSIDKIGIKPATKSLAVVIIDNDPQFIDEQIETLSKYLGSSSDDSILKLIPCKKEKIRDTFQITLQEMKTQGNTKRALVDLIIEKMALVATQA